MVAPKKVVCQVQTPPKPGTLRVDRLVFKHLKQSGNRAVTCPGFTEGRKLVVNYADLQAISGRPQDN